MAVEGFRRRAKRKLIKVTFPSGESICYKNVTSTLIGVLCEIGSERFPEVKLEVGHLPILSKEIYPKYKDWMKPVCDGWYLNAQSNTDQKYLQLRSISESLNLNLKVEIGDDFTTQDDPNRVKKSRLKDNLMVKFPDGEYIANENSIDTFTQTIWQIGIEEIMRKGLEWNGNHLITMRKSHNAQVQIGTDRWLTIPNSTKDRAKLLRVIALHMRIKLEVTII